MVLQVRRFAAGSAVAGHTAWAAGDPFLSGILNTYGVLVPRNERFYISTIRALEPGITDPELSARIDRFVRQEAQHGAAHHAALPLLEGMGYRFRSAARVVNGVVFGIAENLLPLRIRMSMVSCVEYVNAYLGHEVLSQNMLADSDPTLRALYEWHFGEEIEHRAVAFDVLQAVGPSYALRLLGAALTLPLFYALLALGALWFGAQDGSLFRAAWWKGAWRHLFGRHRMLWRTLGHLGAYLDPRFHPRMRLDDTLAAAVMQRWNAHLQPIATP
jgi:predicted metal-dependent hydrolase